MYTDNRVVELYTTDELKKIRKEKGLTIDAISKKLHITASYYWKLENKRRRLFYDTAMQIAFLLDKKPDDLFYPKK